MVETKCPLVQEIQMTSGQETSYEQDETIKNRISKGK